MKLSQWIKGAAFAAAAALLAPTARAASYELSIAGRQVTDANKDDILGDGGSVRFSLTGTNGTLTLSNAAITSGLGNYVLYDLFAGIALADNFALTIVLEGANRVEYASFLTGIVTASPLTITGGGSLWLVPNEGRGIYAEGDLTIDGVTVSAGGSRGGGIECDGTLTITNANVTASNRDGKNGIECQRLSIGGASRLVATTTGTGDVVGKKSALLFQNGIEIGDGLVVLEPSPYWIDDNTIHAEGDSGADGAKRVVIGPPPVPYVERGWDGHAVTESNAVCTDYTVLSDQLTLTNGWYVVKGAFTNADRITVSGEVHLILCDGAVLTATNGIALGTNDSLAVYGQTQDSGTLFAGTDGTTNNWGLYIATCGDRLAGIGGGEGVSGGTLTVHGGTVAAAGGQTGAGIGGAWQGKGGTVTVYGGTVTARGGEYGAGIGGGNFAEGGTVSIYGGTVTARGGAMSAGLGGGWQGAGGDVAIYGGTVTAAPGGPAAAIGKGSEYDGSDGGLVLGGMKVTYPAGTLATNRVEACRRIMDSVTLAVCEPHAYDEADDGRCRWCGSQNPVLVVTFDANGGTCDTASREYARGEPFGWLPEAERPFHDFAGWMTPDGTPVTTNTPATAPFRFLVARWNGRRGVFITGQPESQNVSAGESVTLSVGIRNQAGFRVPLGWGNEVEMLFCPAGTFEMGSPESELGREARYSYRNPDETRHTVVLTHDFWLSRTEITQKQYKDGVMGTNPSAHKEEGRTDLPVDSVSWRDSTNFCLRLTGNEKSAGRLPKGYVFALPTEAEWEYACRAGTTNALASGEELSNTVWCPEMDKVGWYKSNSLSQTHVVGTIWTNAWGFSDMHGNVSEWCWDLYQAAYPTGTVVNPAGPGLPVDGDTFRIHRGGSWNAEAGECRSAARGCDQPSHGGNERGFRLALVRSRDVSVPLSDDLVLELTAVNPDTFQMGSPDGELGRNTNETRHAVTLTQVYWIGKHEVTQAQWLEVMGSYPEAFDGSVHGQGDELPVYATSHAEAVEFCELLTERERAAGRLPAGYRFALPTEAQWEYACRGGTTKALNNDHNLTATTGQCTSLDQVAWYLYNAGGRVHSIHDHKEANSSGQYGGVFQPHSCMEGMHGNVQEWVADWYGDYPAEAVTDPEGPATGTERILRGGGIDDEPADCRSAARIRSPGGAATGTSGLRVAIVPVEGVPRNPDALYPPPEPWDRTSRGESYQWFRDGTPIEGATGASLEIPRVTSAEAGGYTVVVTAGGLSATSAVAVVVVERTHETVDGVTWYYQTNAVGATVTGVASNCATGNLVMPETLGGFAVTAVGVDAFDRCTNITGMAIASGVTNIGEAAFFGCTALATVAFPEGLTGIGLGAFEWCGLTDAVIPDSVACIGEEAFFKCWSLTNAWLGTGIESVGANAFAGCDALETLWLPVEQQGTGLLDAAGLPDGVEIRYYGNVPVAFDANGGTPGSAWQAEVPAEVGSNLSAILGETVPATVAADVVSAPEMTVFGGYEVAIGGGQPATLAPGDPIDLAIAAATGVKYLWTPLYTVTVTGGSSTNQVAAAGVVIDITANEPEDGKAFVQWSSDVEGLAFDDDKASPTTFTMPATNVAVEAVFKPIVITWTDAWDYFYTGSAVERGFTVALEGVGSLASTNYTLSWVDNVNAGTATLTVTLTNRPAGVQSNSFRILPKALEDNMVELTLPTAGWCTYDGTAQQPGFTLSDGDPSILTTNDLVVSWSNNVGPGTATAVFTGTNNYTGRIVKTFEIRWASEPVGGVEWSYRTDQGCGTSATVTGADPAEGDLAVPETLGGLPVAGIGAGAFADATNLTSIVIPDGVADIGEEAFAGCTALTNVWIGTGIETVGTNAFAGCDALETVWLPAGQQGTGLLDAAGVPDGVEIHYYGTQTVTFDANGGTCATATNAVAFGPEATYGELPVPTRTNWTFVGWFDDADGGTQVTAASAVSEETERTLFAHWAHTVLFDANGGSAVSPASRVVAHNAAIGALPVPVRANYTFLGWWTKADGGTQFTEDRAVTRDLTVYARWTKTVKTVRFDPCGGTVSTTSKKVRYDLTTGTQPIGKMPTPKRSGKYVWLGWYTTRNGGTVFTEDRTVPRDLTLYARWKPAWKVVFDANGGTCAIKSLLVQKSRCIAKLPTAARSGFAFVGWYTAKTGGGKVTTSTTIKKDMRVYARWAAAWTVTFDANGGTCATRSRAVKKGAAVGTLPTATKSGWKFLGWYTAKSGGSRVSATTKVNANRTFYAHWERKATAKAAKSAPAVRAAEEAKPVCIAVTASGGGDASAVVDGDGATSWTPGTAEGSWVVLTLEATCNVADVEVLGSNLPANTRFLLSEDADDWSECLPARALYVWVVFPAGDAAPVVKEIRVRGGAAATAAQ